jgi:hypothetical protein
VQIEAALAYFWSPRVSVLSNFGDLPLKREPVLFVLPAIAKVFTARPAGLPRILRRCGKTVGGNKSRADAVIRVYDIAGNVIDTHEPCDRSVRNLRHRQSEALTELWDAFEVEVEPILGPQRRHLFRVAPCGRKLAEEVFESARRNDFDDLAWGVASVPEDVPLLARLSILAGSETGSRRLLKLGSARTARTGPPRAPVLRKNSLGSSTKWICQAQLFPLAAPLPKLAKAAQQIPLVMASPSSTNF